MNIIPGKKVWVTGEGVCVVASGVDPITQDFDAIARDGTTVSVSIVQVGCEMDAIDWLLAVRKFGLGRANEMFPEA